MKFQRPPSRKPKNLDLCGPEALERRCLRHNSYDVDYPAQPSLFRARCHKEMRGG